jgi:hypothetical protein
MSTPSAAVDMLLKRVMTQKAQQPANAASNATQTTTNNPPSAPQQAFAQTKNNQEALPPGWDQRFTATGRPYYVNHNQAGPETDGNFPQSHSVANNYRTPDVEEVNDDDGEDEEHIIDLFPRREPRPY